MNLKTVLQRALNEHDLKTVGKIVEELRFRHGMNYANVQRFFLKYCNVGAEDFETLMAECDEAEARE